MCEYSIIELLFFLIKIEVINNKNIFFNQNPGFSTKFWTQTKIIFLVKVCILYVLGRFFFFLVNVSNDNIYST